jgi:hypothetical protein
MSNYSELDDIVASAYRRMASEARYRPAAPNDGFGNITVPLDTLDLDAEASDYARKWRAEEDTLKFYIGSADFLTRETMAYAIEAARLCASGNPEVVRRLLNLALESLPSD